MEIKEFNGHKIKIFASIDELPIARYNLFNLFQLQESGIGNDINAALARLQKMDMYLTANKSTEAKAELANLQASFYATLTKINFTALSFACLVHSIDGEEYPGLTESEVQRIAEAIQAPSQKQVSEVVSEKKPYSKLTLPPTIPPGSKIR